jgi:bifunctional isochorismate lyase / aryl carrier protein
MTAAFTQTLSGALSEVLDAEFAATALAQPDADLFALGMNSLQAFDVLDRLIEAAGVDVDYADFTSRPTVAFLAEQAALPA